jgi:hypothetical protein
MTMFELRAKIAEIRKDIESEAARAERRGWAESAASWRKVWGIVNHLENKLALEKELH